MTRNEKLQTKEMVGRAQDAFTSMLRTDYISLSDLKKLQQLSDYFVDYFGYLGPILDDIDHLIVGRRGTGKTTLLYRAYYECMKSWDTKYKDKLVAPRTLPIYIDLNKCNSLSESSSNDFNEFEHAFVTELCEAITEQLERAWPALKESHILDSLFSPIQNAKRREINKILDELAKTIREGIPRIIDRSGNMQITENVENSTQRDAGISASFDGKSGVEAKVQSQRAAKMGNSTVTNARVEYRLTIKDVLRIIDDLRVKAEVPAIILLIDEFSALHENQQRRFTTLLKKLLGNHCNVYVKLCVITDHYTLGTSLILQRDLFELPLDFDVLYDKRGSLDDTMSFLAKLAKDLVVKRLSAYGIEEVQLFDKNEQIYVDLSRSAMAIPRTMGIALRYALENCAQQVRSKITISDIHHGIRSASRAYLNAFEGAARDSIAIPEVHLEIWNELLLRAKMEVSSTGRDGSHFVLGARYDHMLKQMMTMFLIHLVSSSRTTKKEKTTRKLYAFDYGICLDNNLGYTTDKNIIRQHRFVYESSLERFNSFFATIQEELYRCPHCQTEYSASELRLGSGILLLHCPVDKHDLVKLNTSSHLSEFTEEETKIIGSIRSASREQNLQARDVADNVGCYVQKVAKFGEKLEAKQIIKRERPTQKGNHIYYGDDNKS